jgi:hypothetical protein
MLHQLDKKMKYYLYRHIRLDKNEPFYIGIGTKKDNYNTCKTEYYRAFSKQRKDSKIWKLVVKKTNYKVEILLESDNYFDIKQKEKEFIKLYGRIDLGTGTLANMTDGGDGTLGVIVSEETRKKLQEAHKNRTYYHGKKIYQYDLEGNFIKEWANITQASKSINVCKSNLSKIIKFNLNNNFCRDFFWTNVYVDKFIPKTYRKDFKTKINMINSNNNEIIKTFDSLADVYKFLGKTRSGLINSAIRRDSKVYGYKWRRVS